jgi:hypothetical protein
MSLVGGGPFTAPATVAGYTYQYVIVLFTDGLNTEDHWYTTQSSIDARQTMTCSNIKAANIQIYTVQISTDGTPMSSLLQNCATDSSKYSYLTSASQVVSTFNTIGTNLSNEEPDRRSNLVALTTAIRGAAGVRKHVSWTVDCPLLTPEPRSPHRNPAACILSF